ncbi:MAG: aryldialkylphosphatase [Rhodospirillales bacterium]|nr:aryldialkylphosphatase [Rhodospirillales bacterium]
MSAPPDLKGKVLTVTGPMAAAALGPTLMHEHLLFDLTRPEVAAQNSSEVVISLENVWEIRRHPSRDYGNQHNRSVDVAMDEVLRMKADGGGAIVDLTTFGIAPDPAGLRRISVATGVPIVQGAGYYVDEYVPAEPKKLGIDALAREMVNQVTTGCWGTDVRAGIIGELGCMWPLRDFERRVLQAAAIAQRETGATISVHPGRHPDAPFEIVKIIREAGGDVGRLIISHVDRTLFSADEALRLADTGCVIEYDFFGIETSYYWFGDADLPTDYMRLGYIRALFDHGHGNRIVVSHDICTKTRLVRYGGHGYGHLFRNVVPLMRTKSFSDAEIQTVFVETPRRLLALV